MRENDRHRAERIRTVATHIERYFAQLGQELAATREAFWKRLERKLASAPPQPPPAERNTAAPPGTVSPDKPLDPK